MALSSVIYSLERMFPIASMQLRMATPTDKAGPVVTDNGNLIIDCDFGPIKEDPSVLYKEIKCLSGILDVGLFCNMAETAYIGHLEGDDGEILYRKQQ
jgi:ribose 5-phosphate isomerase A